MSGIAGRIFNSTAGALRQALSGYHQTSFLLQRDLVEITTLLDVFLLDLSRITRWSAASNDERKKEFSPAALRKLLKSQDGTEAAETRRLNYQLFSPARRELCRTSLKKNWIGSTRFSETWRRQQTRLSAKQAWVANRDGSGLHQVTTMRATELGIGGWSPDGRRIVIDAAIAGNSDVYVVDLDGRPPVRLTSDPTFDGTPEWSSDGQWIYFTSNKSGRPELWKMSANGGTASQLTREGGLQPREAPDGRTLFYLNPPPYSGGMSGVSRLMQVPVEGGEEVVVFDRVRFGLWAVTDSGIIFAMLEREQDALDFYGFRDRVVRRLGVLPFRFSRIAGLGGLTVSRDGRWALASVTDRWESDIMVAEGVR